MGPDKADSGVVASSGVREANTGQALSEYRINVV